MTKKEMKKSLHVQPVSFEGLCENYAMNIKTGELYRLSGDEYSLVDPVVGSFDEPLKYEVTWKDGTTSQVLAEEILCKMLYGPTNSSTIRHVYKLPAEVNTLSPKIYNMKWASDDNVVINGMNYCRWGKTHYFVSTMGSVFSELMGQFFRLHYSTGGHPLISLNDDMGKKSIRTAILVYYVYIGKEIPDGMDLSYKDGNLWNSDVDNIQIVTHNENLWSLNPDNFRGFSEEKLRGIVADLNAGIKPKAIAAKYDIPRAIIWKIRSGAIYAEDLKHYGLTIDYSKQSKERPFTADDIMDIRKRAANGEPVRLIAKHRNVSVQTIYGIINGKTYTDIGGEPIKKLYKAVNSVA